MVKFTAKFLTAAYKDVPHQISLQTAQNRKLFVYYRGTEPGRTERITTGNPTWDSYLFVADDPKKARNYGSSIEQVTLKPDAKILREGTREFIRVAGKWRQGENLLAYVSRAAQQAVKAGYDAIHFKMQGDVGTAILNRDAIESRIPYKTASDGLVAKLKNFCSQLAAIAQNQYDEWDASGEYGDSEVGFGGICHLIADGWADLLSGHGYNVTTWSHSDEVHVSLMVWEDVDEEFAQEVEVVDEEFAQEVEVVDVDLNPHIYEKGGGYNWTKIPNVTIDPSDITFYRQFMSQENLEALQQEG